MKLAAKWCAVLVLLYGFAAAEQLSVLSFVILKDYNGKPIRNASVSIQPLASLDEFARQEEALAQAAEAAILEMLRVVREEEPPRPSVKLSTTTGRANIAATRGWNVRQNASPVLRPDANTPSVIVDDDPLLR